MKCSMPFWKNTSIKRSSVSARMKLMGTPASFSALAMARSISPMPSTALSVRFVQTIIRKKNPKRRKKIVTRFFCRSLAPHPAAHILHSILRERNQPEGHSGNYGSCGYFHYNGCICRSDPREKERIHDLAAKCTACAVRHRFKITEMFLSAGQRSTSRLSRFDSEQHPLSRFPSRSIKKGL